MLIDENGDFEAFGLEAEAKYADDVQDGDAKKSLFRHFKMVLHTTDVREPLNKVTFCVNISIFA